MTGEMHVSRERAKALIDEHQAGTIIVADVEPKPTIGNVPEDERELEGDLETYRFGKLGVDDD